MLQDCLHTQDYFIANIFYAHVISFKVAHSPYFKQTFKDVIFIGHSFVPPREHKLCIILLNREYSRVTVDGRKERNLDKGCCSIIIDELTNIKHQTLMNIIVMRSSNTYFLRAIDHKEDNR